MTNENETRTAIYTFFIGQNNKTKKAEYKKAERVFLRFNVMGFSLTKRISGFWGGEAENSFKVEIIANEFNPFNDKKAEQIKTELEKDLKQDLVLTTKQNLTIL